MAYKDGMVLGVLLKAVQNQQRSVVMTETVKLGFEPPVRFRSILVNSPWEANRTTEFSMKGQQNTKMYSVRIMTHLDHILKALNELSQSWSTKQSRLYCYTFKPCLSSILLKKRFQQPSPSSQSYYSSQYFLFPFQSYEDDYSYSCSCLLPSPCPYSYFNSPGQLLPYFLAFSFQLFYYICLFTTQLIQIRSQICLIEHFQVNNISTAIFNLLLYEGAVGMCTFPFSGKIGIYVYISLYSSTPREQVSKCYSLKLVQDLNQQWQKSGTSFLSPKTYRIFQFKGIGYPILGIPDSIKMFFMLSMQIDFTEDDYCTYFKGPSKEYTKNQICYYFSLTPAVFNRVTYD